MNSAVIEKPGFDGEADIEELPFPDDDLNIIGRIAWFTQHFPGVKKGSYNTFTDSYYASLDDIWAGIKYWINLAGLIPIQRIEGNTLYTTIYSIDGKQEISSAVPLSPEKETSQGFGSNLTYMRRYSICTMLNIVESTDDDGNAAERARQETTSAKKAIKLMENVAQGPGAALKYWLSLGDYYKRNGVFKTLNNHQKGELRKALIDARERDEKDQLSEYVRQIVDCVMRDDDLGMKQLSEEMTIDEKYAVYLELTTDISTKAKELVSRK
ncbi:MAG: ERF family protein [Cyclobacteriaceae bacterium]|nr:ERF family protein [Cyclobacteriaceae bacterium]